MRSVAIKGFRHKGLERFFAAGDGSGIQAKHAVRLRLILGRLNVATVPRDIDLPGLALHQLHGSRRGTLTVSISGNLRVTFRWNAKDVDNVNYEDCH